jgi:hypothetical protein
MKSIQLTLVVLGISFSMHAQAHKPLFPMMVIEGNYQGKNLYIQNPASEDNKGFCTKQVIVNGKQYAFKRESAFVIQLDTMNFKLGTPIKIEIEHADDCKPKVIYDNSTPKRTPDIDLKIDSTGVLRWQTK